MRAIAQVLAPTDFPITIEGHTDNMPINTAQFPSNWELSAVRATTVLRLFADSGVAAERLTAIGYADTRPVEPNLLADGRARNRRVTILIDSAGVVLARVGSKPGRHAGAVRTQAVGSEGRAALFSDGSQARCEFVLVLQQFRQTINVTLDQQPLLAFEQADEAPDDSDFFFEQLSQGRHRWQSLVKGLLRSAAAQPRVHSPM
jgi:hypothetical protein